MKLIAKPISSPSRPTDKFPPPVLRFLRSNGGSKSRGRSRSSPIFIRKRSDNQAETARVITQEPSSPKVTCMGQVRVRTQKLSKKKKRKKVAISGYQWIRKKLFCCDPKSSKPFWRRESFPFYRRKLEMKRGEKPEEIDDVEEEEEEEEKAEVFVTKTPPKNALLLMRCRSEPYRASSLANQFWGSPPRTEQKHRVEEDEEGEEEKRENPTMENEPPSCIVTALESETDLEIEEEKLRFCGSLASNSTRRSGGGGVRPMLLTRCKSEPARTSKRFEGFWKKGLGFIDITTTRF